MADPRHGTLEIANATNIREASTVHVARTFALVCAATLTGLPPVLAIAFATKGYADAVHDSPSYDPSAPPTVDQLRDHSVGSGSFATLFLLVTTGVVNALAFVPSTGFSLVALYGLPRLRKVLAVLFVPGTVLHAVIVFLPLWKPVGKHQGWYVALFALGFVQPLCVVVAAAVWTGRIVQSGHAWKVLCGMFLALAGAVALYFKAIFPAFFSSGFEVALLLRTVCHSAIRHVSLFLGVRAVKLLTDTPPAARVALFVPPALFTSFAVRYMQLSSPSIAFVMASEVVALVLELSETYQLLARNRPFALVRDLAALARRLVNGDGSKFDAAAAHFFVEGGGGGTAKEGDVSGEQRPQHHDDAFYGNLVHLLAVSEALSTVLIVAVLLVVPVNPKDYHGSPLSWQTIVTNAAIVLFGELVLTDLAVAMVSARLGPVFGLVDVTLAWQQRSRVAGAMVLVFGGLFAATVPTFAFAPLCVGDHDGSTMLARCP